MRRIGLSFREVEDPNEAEIRIAFDHTDGSWSYLGRQQANFLIRPNATRKYTFQTFGDGDTVMVLFTRIGEGPEEGQGLRYLAGHDDSGTESNSTITAKLFKGAEYVRRVRVVWPSDHRPIRRHDVLTLGLLTLRVERRPG